MRETECQVLWRPNDEKLEFLPEGPYRLDDRHLSWVAIQHGATADTGSLNILDLATRRNATHDLPGRPGFAFPTDRPGTFVVGLERRIQSFDVGTGETTALSDPVDGDVEGTIINDGLVLDDCLIFGTKDLKFERPKASLYLWRATDGRPIRLRGGQTCSNGKAVVTRDGESVLLDIDTPTKTVVAQALDVVRGELGDPRVVVDLRDGDVFPDGMILTPDGESIIVALYNPADAPYGEARQYDLKSGRVEAVWRTPGSPQVTCPQLVRIDGRVMLVLTTAVEHMPAQRRAKHANAGCLFVGETSFDDVTPQPVFPISRQVR